MSVWYEIDPADTLFFRGAEPMEAGQLTATALFPPPISVLQGSVRTAVLRQRGVSFKEYNGGRAPEDVVDLIGKSGTDAPFDITAILFRLQGRMYGPAPASWFVDMDRKPTVGADLIGRTVKAPGRDEDLSRFNVLTTCQVPPLVPVQGEAVSLAGWWVDLELYSRTEPVFSDGDALSSAELFDMENRVGIAMDRNRKVVDGKLYSAGHIRLREGVSMLVGVSADVGLQETGTLLLGGEQRVCGYRKCDGPSVPEGEGGRFVSLAPVPADNALLDDVVCAGKSVVLAGWDMDKMFHKPTRTWLPAGTVFSRKINSACVPLAC